MFTAVLINFGSLEHSIVDIILNFETASRLESQSKGFTSSVFFLPKVCTTQWCLTLWVALTRPATLIRSDGSLHEKCRRETGCCLGRYRGVPHNEATFSPAAGCCGNPQIPTHQHSRYALPLPARPRDGG